MQSKTISGRGARASATINAKLGFDSRSGQPKTIFDVQQ